MGFGDQIWDGAVQAGITGRFRSYDPEQLWQMVEAADGSTPKQLGDLLTGAAKKIREIGNDLRTHSMAIEWDGEAGEAFRKWCHGTAMSTLRLGDYSESAGKWMSHAADTLQEVKPQIDTLRRQAAASKSIMDAHAASGGDAGSSDSSPSEAEAKGAKSQYGKDHADAAALMVKLAQSYSSSSDHIDELEPPKFPDLPEEFVPRNTEQGSGDLARGGAGINGPAGGPAGVGPSANGQLPGAPVGSSGPGGVTAPAGEASRPGRPAEMGIDSVAEAPPMAPPSPGPSQGQPPAAKPETVAPIPGGPVPSLPSAPQRTGGAKGGRPTGGARLPLPPQGSDPAGRLPSNNGIIGGRPVPPATGRTGGPSPRGTVIGGPPGTGATPVGRPAGTGAGTTGRSPASGTTAPISRGVPGAVRGDGRSATGSSARTGSPVSRGVFGAPPSVAGTSSSGRTGGSSAQGVVGAGRQPASGQSAASPRSGSPAPGNAARTPGKTTAGSGTDGAQGRNGANLGSSTGAGKGPSGTARRSDVMGVPLGRNTTPGRDPQERRGSSGYATEPEETWQQDSRRPVPPVIE